MPAGFQTCTTLSGILFLGVVSLTEDKASQRFARRSGRLLSHFLRSVPATPGFQILPVTALPSSCPFFCLAAEFRDEVSFRHMMYQSRRNSTPFSVHFGAEALCSLKPCDSVFERTFPVSIDLLNIRGPGPFCPDFGSPDAQTRRSD
jgi:hypothetical protein